MGLHRCFSFVGKALHSAWPRVVVRDPSQIVVPVEIIDCEDWDQLERRSAWLMDGRSARKFLRSTVHAIVLRTPADGQYASHSRLHVAVSHGVADGFSGLPLLQDLRQLYAKEKDGSSGTGTQTMVRLPDPPPSCLALLENRLGTALCRSGFDD